MQKKCLGCGSPFQHTSRSLPGYVKEDLLANNEHIICQRCYRLKHYNEDITIESNSYNHQLMFQKAIEKNALIVYIIDIFNLTNSILENYHKELNKLDCLLVVNKYDLLSKSISLSKANKYISKYVNDINLQIKDLIIISSYRKNDIEILINKIKYYSKSQEIYFVGASNVGKSSILNNIIKKTKFTNIELTVSNLIKTTLKEIEIPFYDKVIIDTPGVILKNHYPYFLTKKTLEKVTPKKIIKPKVFQLQSLQSLFINGFVQINILNGNPSIVTYFENNLLIHRTKLSNAEKFFLSHQDDILSLPTVVERKLLGNRKKYVYQISEDYKKDIEISGLGFFSVIGNATIEVWVYEPIDVVIREALV